MEGSDVVDERVTKLQAFHISARSERLAHQENLRLDRIAIQTISAVTLYSPHRIGGRPLPDPAPGNRPCWEPPILDYSWFDDLITAQKEMDKRDGSKDLAWRTETMDNVVEDALLRTYFYDYLRTMEKPPLGYQPSFSNSGSYPEAMFWQGLRGALWDDIHKLYVEGQAIRKRYGKRNREHAELLIGVKAIAVKNNENFGAFYGNKRLAVNEHVNKLKKERVKQNQEESLRIQSRDRKSTRLNSSHWE